VVFKAGAHLIRCHAPQEHYAKITLSESGAKGRPLRKQRGQWAALSLLKRLVIETSEKRCAKHVPVTDEKSFLNEFAAKRRGGGKRESMWGLI